MQKWEYCYFGQISVLGNLWGDSPSVWFMNEDGQTEERANIPGGYGGLNQLIFSGPYILDFTMKKCVSFCPLFALPGLVQIAKIINCKRVNALYYYKEDSTR